MKKNQFKVKRIPFALAIAAAVVMAGCGADESSEETNQESSQAATVTSSITTEENETENVAAGASALEVQFGSDGEAFVMEMEDNPTADAIVKHVGTANWQLPIYHYDDYEDWEVMQYYDIPSRYEIPSGAETITSQKAGEVYYSEPNRIILFYHDGEVTGEYTKIGTIEATPEFQEAVENNPVLEGWGNKLVLINSLD